MPGVDTTLLDPRSTWARPGGLRREGAASSRSSSARTSSSSRTSTPRSPPPGRVPEREAPRVPLAFDSWKRRTTCSSSARAARGCGPRSRRTTPAPTSRSISKLHPTRSHSGAAEGGINAALGNAAEDSPEPHAFDTVKGSDFLADQDAVEIFAREAPDDIYELEHWGAVFSRADDGRLAQRPFGAAGSPRTVFAADITGPRPDPGALRAARQARHPRLRGVLRLEAVEDGGRCQGVIAWDLHARRAAGDLGDARRSSPRAASGGSTGSRRTPTPARATAPRWRSALGLPLKDMEFMQFHPTTLYPTGILMTEGCRGEGAFLINKDGERFMKRYAPNALELASRDVVSRSEQTEIDEGRGVNGSVMLDMRHLGAAKIIERLPGLARARDHLRRRRPASTSPMPVRPGAHYHMGGVATDADGRHGARRAVRGGRGRVRLRPRRQPARRQLADGDDHLRPARRPRRGRRGAARRRRRACRSRRSPTRESELDTLLLARTAAASGRGRSARSSARRCSRTSASSAARTRCRSRSAIIDGLRERYEQRRRRGQGRRLQQRPHAGARARRLPRARRRA